MNIDRAKEQGGEEESIYRLDFVLSHIEDLEEDADEFFKKKWGDRLTYEEIIGALVGAEQALNNKHDFEDSK